MLRRGREVYHSARVPYCDSPVRERELPVRDLTNQTRAHDREEAPPLGTVLTNRVAYRRLADPTPPALAVVGFGTSAVAPPSVPLRVDVGLEPVGAEGDMGELWLADGSVTAGRIGSIRYAADARALFGVIELDEREYGGLAAAAEAAYREIAHFQSHSIFPALLRMWNYMDGINVVSEGLERYRQFCLGRARGLGSTPSDQYPAASGIGRQRPTHQLQVYWLAGRSQPKAIENPRQVSAYHYPPEHGPASPSFSRASIASDGTMFVSGTASIVGHVSLHRDDLLAQLEETLRNLTALTAHHGCSIADPRDGDCNLLKVYVRNPADAPHIREALRKQVPACPVLFLAGDICREELLLEIELICQSISPIR
jgi:chorismate lyase / 3-hydroxybenzoate synthase